MTLYSLTIGCHEKNLIWQFRNREHWQNLRGVDEHCISIKQGSSYSVLELSQHKTKLEMKHVL